MADGHVGYVMPIGGVAAYDNAVSVVGVGFDIACGNAAIRTDLTLADLGENRRPGATAGSIDAGRRDRRDAELRRRPEEPRRRRADRRPAVRGRGVGRGAREAPPGAAGEGARSSSARSGSGNHYVDVFADEAGALWVGVHFGSRGFGHTVASSVPGPGPGCALGRAGAGDGGAAAARPAARVTTTGTLMELAGRYAYAGREWVARKVVSMLGGRELELVHNHHNFAWKEQHDGEELVVVRKGATPAFPGQNGFIGGSMGDDAVIVRGTAPTIPASSRRRSGTALFSTVHGAGRVMSRTAAAGKRQPEDRPGAEPTAGSRRR